MTTRLVTASKLLLATLCLVAAPQLACTKSASSTTVAGQALGERTLALIPADTPYAWVTLGAKNPLLSGSMWGMQAAALIEGLRAVDDGSNEVEAKLARAVLAEVVDGKRVRSLGELGFALDGRFALYGLSIWPVLRLEIRDGAPLRAAVTRVMAALGPQIRQQRRDGTTYWVAELNEMSAVIAVLDREAVLAILPSASVTRSLPLLFGTERPASSLESSGKLRTIAKQFAFTSDMLIFFDLRAIVQIMTGQGQGLNHDLGAPVREALGPSVIACRPDLERLAAFARHVIVGYNRLDERGYEAEMYVETPAAFNQALAGLRTSSPAPSTTPGVEPRIALSAGVDVDKLLAWLGELAAGLKAAPLTCPWLAELNTVADELSQLSGGLPPMLRGLRGLSIVVDDFQLAPPSGTAHLIVVGDQVQAIVGLLQQLPLFAGLPAPTLGIPVAVPVQQLGLAGVTSAHLSVSNERFGLAVGDDSAARLVRAMATPDQQRSPLFSIGYDMEWFREQFPSDDPDRFSDADHVTIVLDVGKRGLVMGVKVRWVPTLAR